MLFALLLISASPSLPQTPFAADHAVEARLLDPKGDPFADAKVLVGFHHSAFWRGYEASTDADGTIHCTIRLSRMPSGGKRQSLQFFVSQDGVTYETEVLLTGRIAEVHDLGDLRLYDPSAPDRWASFDDDELVLEWSRWSALAARREREGILREAGRRQGPSWEAFLEEVLVKLDQESEWVDESMKLCALRAQRIAQGRDDPVQLQISDETGVEKVWAFGELPFTRLELRNVDDEMTFKLTKGGSYRSGRFARLAVEMTDEAGMRIPSLPSPGGMGGGMWTTRIFGPGARMPLGCDIAAYISAPLPGNYSLRMHYHDTVDIADRGGGQGYFTMITEPTAVTVRPRRIEVSRKVHAALLDEIAAIDLEEPVWLTSTPWSPTMEFVGEPRSPQDRLFRAGWRAMPALLEALGAKQLDKRRADWIMGLCHGITGLYHPGGITGSKIKRYRWSSVWPTSDAEGRSSFGEWTGKPAAVDEATHLAYKTQWLNAAKGLDVTWGD